MSIHQFCREIDDYVQKVYERVCGGGEDGDGDMQKLFAIKSTGELLFCAELGQEIRLLPRPGMNFQYFL